MRLCPTLALSLPSAALVTALLASPASAQTPPDQPASPAATAPDQASPAATAPDQAAPAAPPAAAPPAAAPAPAAAPVEPKEPDKVRFRSGFGAYGGGLIWPDVFTLGVVGLQGETGVQINHMIGVYAVPNFEFAFGDAYGIKVGGAVVCDFTFLDHFTVGAGPDVAAMVAFGIKDISAASTALYGGRIHLAVHPAVGRRDDGIRRRAFTIGVDLRFYSGNGAFASTGGAAVALNNFVFMPTASLAYTGF